MAGLIDWLERFARQHLMPIQDVTSAATRGEVRASLDEHNAVVAELEQEVLDLSRRLAQQATDEHQARQQLDEWRKREAE